MSKTRNETRNEAEIHLDNLEATADDVVVNPETGEILIDANKRLDSNGHEILDPTPMAIPVRFQRSPSLLDIVRQEAFNRQSGLYQDDTDDDDFSEDDEMAPSPHELRLSELVRSARKIEDRKARLAADQSAWEAQHRGKEPELPLSSSEPSVAPQKLAEEGSTPKA